MLREAPATHLVTDVVRCAHPGAEALVALRGEFPQIELIAISSAPQCAGYLRLAATLDAPASLAQSFMSGGLMELCCSASPFEAREGAHRIEPTAIGREGSESPGCDAGGVKTSP